MTARAKVLECYGLKDCAVFAVDPVRDDPDMWRVEVHSNVAPPLLISIGHATRLAENIRMLDDQLAKQLDAALMRAGHESSVSF